MKEEISTEDKSLLVDSLFKKLILINNSLFKLIENLVKRSIKKLEISLSKSDHNPQIGLLFSLIIIRYILSLSGKNRTENSSKISGFIIFSRLE